MRVALLIVLLLLPAGLAQTQVLEDDEGDATASAGGTAAPAVDPASFDLVGLWVQEDVNEFQFTVQLGDVDPENPTPNDTGVVDVDLNHADQGYRLRLLRDTTTGQNRFGAQFMVYDAGRGDYVVAAFVQPVLDPAAETATMTIPRSWLLDGNGTAPTIGREFDYFRAFARNSNTFNGPGFPTAVQIRDAMPDTGYGDVPYPIQLGLKQSGHAFLESATPVRASNGEKGTFVFYVSASNLGAEEDRFDLATSGVPAQWEVTLPASSIRLRDNETRTFPVLVSVPFAHQHGAFENLKLEMTSTTDPGSIGRIELGIRYLETPQPAGHHDQLHIHTRERVVDQNGIILQFGDEPRIAYFNTLEDDDKDQDVSVAPAGGFLSFGRQVFQWTIYLEPGLQMGLDFDLNRTGEITAQFTSETNLHTATMNGYIAHIRFGGDDGPGQATTTVLATITPSSPEPIAQSTAIESVIRPTKASDLIPYAKQAAMVMVLNLTIQDGMQLVGGENTDPLLTGGQFSLPLNEYRDAIEGVFNSLAGLQFANTGETERPVNPGEAVLFNLTLENKGAVDDIFDLRVNGTNAAWARILGDKEIFVPTGSKRPVVIAVVAPADAPHLDVADLIVTAASKAEPTIQGNIRVIALVDDVLDHADESYLVPALDDELASKKKSPPAPVMVMSLAIVASAAAMRRRRA